MASASIPGDASTTETVEIGSGILGTIDAGGDRDWFELQLTEGEEIRIVLDGAGSDPLEQPQVILRDANGDQVAGLAGIGSATVTYTVPQGGSGTYYVDVGDWRNDTGDYSLSIAPALPQGPVDGVLGDSLLTIEDPILVYFAGTGDTYDATFGNATSQFAADTMTDYEATQLWSIFEGIETFTALDFEITTSKLDADLELAIADLSDANVNGTLLGFATFPNTFGVGGPAVLNNAHIGWDDQAGGGVDKGGFNYTIGLHEVGHLLGLAHPHDTGNGSDVFDGVASPSSLGDFGLNQSVFSVMGYNEGYVTSPSNPFSNRDYGYNATFGAIDIAALQQAYGANTGYASGDDVYTLDAANGAETGYATLWDTGGHDKIRHTGAAGAVIDLRAATLEYASGGGGFVSRVGGVFGGFTIAFGVEIEEAEGGDGADILIGSEGDNTLSGGGGDDELHGGLGDDVLTGGLGDDAVVFANALAAYQLSFDGTVLTILGEGTDTVDASVETLNFGAETYDFATLAAANLERNRIEGTAGPDDLSGTEGPDEIGGLGDADTLSGAGDDDLLEGGAGNDYLIGGTGDDEAFGGTGGDTLLGDSGVDSLYGGSENDTLFGGTGADLMAGGAGDDRFTVDDAGDQVVERADEGTDVVIALVDYTLSDHVENLSLVDGAPVTGAGNARDNRILGNANANTLSGLGGADLINGQAGADAIIGGEGDDIAYGGNEGDAIEGGLGDDALFGDGGADTLSGDAGADTIYGGVGADALFGGLGDDIYLIDEAGDRVVEGTGADGTDLVLTFVDHTLGAGFENATALGDAAVSLTGNTAENRITGNDAANAIAGLAGTDSLYGLGGDDTLTLGDDGGFAFGGAGLDTLTGGAGDDGLQGQDGEDTVYGGAGSDLIYGGGANDRIFAGAGDDFVFSNDGDDTVEGGLGADALHGDGGTNTLIGGAGDDRYFVRSALDQVVELAGEGVDRLFAYLDLTLPDQVEDGVLMGAAEGGTGSALTGNAGNNAMTGNEFGNLISGEGGEDYILGVGGVDLLSGGAGADTLFGGGDADLLVGGSENDFLGGDAGDDTLNGDGGADTLDGGTGADVMQGGSGDDRYTVDDAGDQVVEQAGGGTDRVIALISFTLGDAIEDLVLAGGTDGTGNEEGNFLFGNAAANTLSGDGGGDTIYGQDGADLIEGGAGADTLYGGEGADRFFFAAVDQGPDRIADFAAGDQIALSATLFAAGAGPLPAGGFTLGTEATGTAAQLLYDGATGTLRFDADGTGAGAAATLVTLDGTPDLDEADFTLL